MDHQIHKKHIEETKKFCKKYRLNGFKAYDKVIVDRIREECFQTIKTCKENYLKSLGDKQDHRSKNILEHY